MGCGWTAQALAEPVVLSPRRDLDDHVHIVCGTNPNDSGIGDQQFGHLTTHKDNLPQKRPEAARLAD
jgi:hypothetical protein